MQSNHPKPTLKVVLTQQDKIVPDATALFQHTKDYPTKKTCGQYVIGCESGEFNASSFFSRRT